MWEAECRDDGSGLEIERRFCDWVIEFVCRYRERRTIVYLL